MTVPSTARRAGPYNGNGVTTSFSFSFKTFAAGDLQVTKTATNGIETVLVLNSNYTVSLNVDQDASPGGTITFPISGTPLASGEKLTIVGDLDYDQTTDLLGGGSFNARVIEDTFDRTVIQIQQLDERADRTLVLPVSAAGVSTQLPVPSANALIGWDGAGTGLRNVDPTTLVTAIAYANWRTDVFNGTGSATQFVLTADPGNVNNMDVAIGGVAQAPTTDYTVSGTTLTFTSAPPVGTANIVVRYGQALPVGTADASMVTFLQAGTGAQPRTAEGKMRDVISVKDFGAVGNGSADDTAAIQAAMNAASAAGLPLQFAGGTYAVSATTALALTAPATLTMVGVPGVTTIKLISTTVDTHIIGRSSASTYFQMEGITLDGNRSVITTRNTGGLYFSNAQVVISRNNVYKDMNDLGAYASKAIYVEAPTLGEYAESTGDQYLNCEGYPFQTYRIARNLVQDCYCTGALVSFTDINGQFIPSTTHAKTRISNNVVVCDAAFPVAFSVLSLMGNDIECVGNKVVGGGVQVVIHTGTTDLLYNYFVSGNSLWSAKANAITVNQTSGTSAHNRNIVISGNMIYQPVKDGIAIIGTYAGGSTVPQAGVAITGNVIYDYLTDNPSPGALACIRTLGAVNATITDNSIAGPRWAGIYCEYDGRNIVIGDNVVVDHQGRTDTAPQHGGAIFIGAGNATAYLGNISISGNTVRNFCSTVSPVSTSIRTGGIVVNEAKAQDISIRSNRVMTGQACGISLYNCVRVTAADNEVSGFGAGAAALNTAAGVGAGCELAYAISGPTYATTANRPTLQSTQAGYSMWDSTINEPIWWNGSAWKDADNNTV